MTWHSVLPCIALAVLICGCGSSRVPDQAPAADSPSTPVEAPVPAGSLTAYGVGRRRELELTVAALSLIACASSADERAVAIGAAAPDHIEADGARSADLRAADYRALTARVDSQLVRHATDGLGALTPAMARRFDSLRVALVVARARVAAEAARAFDAAARGRRGC